MSTPSHQILPPVVQGWGCGTLKLKIFPNFLQNFEYEHLTLGVFVAQFLRNLQGLCHFEKSKNLLISQQRIDQFLSRFGRMMHLSLTNLVSQ